MANEELQINLDDFPGIFAVPQVTSGPPPDSENPSVYIKYRENIKQEWQESFAQQQFYVIQEWHRLNEQRDASLAENHIKAMRAINGMLALTNNSKGKQFAYEVFSYDFSTLDALDEYILQILSDWQLEVNPNEAIRSLLYNAEQYSNLFYVRAACLLQAAEICEQHRCFAEAKRLYLAILAAIPEIVENTSYMDNAEKRYLAIQDEGRLPYSLSSTYNPISYAQEALVHMRIKKQNISIKANKILPWTQNAIRFQAIPAKEEQIGQTRFGGLPDVPPDWRWPDGHLEFLVQFNFEEIAPYDHNGLLPRKGLLSVFVRNLCYGWNEDGTDCQIQFYDGDFNELRPAEAPEEFNFYGEEKQFGSDLWVYKPMFVTPYQAISTADSYFLYQRKIFSDDFLREFEKLNLNLKRGLEAQWDDQILGFYSDGAIEAWEQSTGKKYYQLPESEKAVAHHQIDDWVLLMQIDSHDALGMMFSDAGILFLMIRKEDLVARRFDRVFITMICG